MPELPDIQVYLEALEPRITGRTLAGVRLGKPFVLRSVDPPIVSAHGRAVTGLRRMGKRIVIDLHGDLHLVVHLMIAGRLHWKAPGSALNRKTGLAAFDFPEGTLVLTEAGSKRRASLHLVAGSDALAAHDPGGLDVLQADPRSFRAALARERHTLKRALTDPRIFSGIGNAYSDEILHRARLSPFRMSDALDAAETRRLRTACREVLTEWTGRLRKQTGDGFPEKVTAFRDEMAVHGKYRRPCPVCQAPIQRIVYAENESNYCARCQTEGRILADRSLSRLLKDDWPRTIEELETRGLGTRLD